MSLTATVILILIAVVVTLGAVVYVFSKSLKAKKKELADAQARLNSARANIEQLLKYFKDMEKITNDEKSISKKIKEAENDEEIYNIIADIVGSNNNRVQNN